MKAMYKDPNKERVAKEVQAENCRLVTRMRQTISPYNAIQLEESYRKRKHRLQTFGKYPYILDKPVTPCNPD